MSLLGDYSHRDRLDPLGPAARARAADPESIRFARSLARKVGRAFGCDPDLAESAAFYGLTLAARNYDPALSGSFWPYAKACIVREIAGDIRRCRPGKRSRSRVVLVPAHECPHDSHPPSPDYGAADVDYRDWVEGITSRLPAGPRRVLRAMALDCPAAGGCRDAARALGVGKSKAIEDRARGLALLRDRE